MKKNNNIYIEAIPYPDLRGMDLRGEGSLAYLENMYVDHDGSADAIESIPGYRSVVRMKEKIHSFCLIGVGETESLVIHSGSRLYIGRTNVVDKDISLSEIARLKDSESSAITLGDICLITDDERMLSVDRHGNVREVNGDERITSCSCATLYDGRIFLSGSKDHRGYLFISNTLGDGEIRFEESLKTACDGEILSLISADGYLIIFHKDGVICHKAAIQSKIRAPQTNGCLPRNSFGFDVHLLSRKRTRRNSSVVIPSCSDLPFPRSKPCVGCNQYDHRRSQNEFPKSSPRIYGSPLYDGVGSFREYSVFNRRKTLRLVLHHRCHIPLHPQTSYAACYSMLNTCGMCDSTYYLLRNCETCGNIPHGISGCKESKIIIWVKKSAESISRFFI